MQNLDVYVRYHTVLFSLVQTWFHRTCKNKGDKIQTHAYQSQSISVHREIFDNHFVPQDILFVSYHE